MYQNLETVTFSVQNSTLNVAVLYSRNNNILHCHKILKEIY